MFLPLPGHQCIILPCIPVINIHPLTSITIVMRSKDCVAVISGYDAIILLTPKIMKVIQYWLRRDIPLRRRCKNEEASFPDKERQSVCACSWFGLCKGSLQRLHCHCNEVTSEWDIRCFRMDLPSGWLPPSLLSSSITVAPLTLWTLEMTYYNTPKLQCSYTHKIAY